MEWSNYPSDVNIQSPPKLTRIVHLDSSKFLLTAAGSRPSSQQNGDEDDCTHELPNQFSLPALAGEVADAQKQQANELSTRQQVFEELQKEHAKVQHMIANVKEEVSNITRKVVLAEEEAFQCKYQCQQKEKDVKKLLDLQRQLKTKVKDIQNQIEKNKTEYNRYVDKMDSHRSLVVEFELSSDFGKQISKLEENIKSLSEQVSLLKDGQNHSEMGINEEYEILHTEIALLQQSIHDREEEVKQQNLQMKKEVERQAQLQKDIHLLQKRNHAQLTRLQRQLQEALGRSRHWNDEACKLETSIAQIREKLEE